MGVERWADSRWTSRPAPLRQSPVRESGSFVSWNATGQYQRCYSEGSAYIPQSQPTTKGSDAASRDSRSGHCQSQAGPPATSYLEWGNPQHHGMGEADRNLPSIPLRTLTARMVDRARIDYPEGSMTSHDYLASSQGPVEDVRNALTMAQLGAKGYIPYEDRLRAFGDISRLLEHALVELERSKL